VLPAGGLGTQWAPRRVLSEGWGERRDDPSRLFNCQPRLVNGIGQGWMPEDFTAAGMPISRRGGGFEDHLAAMRACWGPDPVEHDGPRYRIPRSKIGPKPLNGCVPVLIGATSRPAGERAARLGDGFAAAFQDWETARNQITGTEAPVATARSCFASTRSRSTRKTPLRRSPGPSHQ
jgi:alkanesulfonate monooxygenase SsuD/methylene tetrahydromethanopterin reductase-like flavin-dependent oxidoreductase (luciferase family)